MPSSPQNSRKRGRVEDAASAAEVQGETEACQDTTIVLNVGGTLITTLKSTLCAQPSRFTEWIHNDFKGFPKDEDGHPFIDRDVVNFKHIVNYMRGYGLPTKSADLVLLAEDAMFYEVEALRKEIGMDQPLVWRFNPGPGVTPEGMEFSTTNILGVCGQEPLAHGESHSRLFRIDRCEKVAIGVLGTHDVKSVRTDQQLYDHSMSVSYCRTGELIHYWYGEKMYTTGAPFKAQDIIEVRVEFPDESAGPVTSRNLFAPYMDTGGATPVALPPPPAIPSETATGASGEDPSPQWLRGQPPQLPTSPGLAASASPVVNAETETAPPVYVGPSPSLSHAYSSLNNGSGSNAVSSYDNASAEDVPIGAVITIVKAGKVEFVVHWPRPVPPLHYAVSMQGASSVTLLEPSADGVPLGSPGVGVASGNLSFPSNPQTQSNIPAPPPPPSRLPPRAVFAESNVGTERQPRQ